MKSFPKVNIFLKITGKLGSYHKLISRFMLVKSIYDELEFVSSSESSFNIEGNFSCAIEQNSIYRAYLALKEELKDSKDLDSFFKYNKVVVQKRVPEGAGLGGGSSNAATFLKMIDIELNLKLSKETLSKVGSKVGADVPFFIYDFEVANVSGVGEIVEEFREDALNLNIFTPEIFCDTKRVYQKFRESFYMEFKDAQTLKEIDSIDIFEKFSIEMANDLYLPALSLYIDLKEYAKEGFLFSGSGSSFFSLSK